jgi:Flp pilus assembly protein TadB
VIYLILIHLPQNYFVYIHNSSTAIPFSDYPALRIIYLVLKNIFGGVFVLAGLAMLVLPGQGIISIVLGLSLLSLPGKRRLVRRLVGLPSVLQTINRLRRRAGKPPLQAPESHA